MDGGLFFECGGSVRPVGFFFFHFGMPVSGFSEVYFEVE